MSSSSDALGGYIQLELPERHHIDLSSAFMFNSARSALSSLLADIGARKVWLPNYICDSVVDAVLSGGQQIGFYSLNEDFSVRDGPILDSGAIILYVNYFGLCRKQALAVISKYGKERVVIDNSQAFFCSPLGCLGALYSPRKFFGLPDGGLLYSEDERISQPNERDDSSEDRMAHLISRLVKSPEAGYPAYVNAEEQIARMTVLGMSRLTERLLQSVDVETAKANRKRNARYLHSRLGSRNQLSFDIDDDNVPLCYPLLPCEKTADRSALIKKRIFLPCYWPESIDRVEEGSFEWQLVTHALFLPCDQRYSEADMDSLIDNLDIE